MPSYTIANSAGTTVANIGVATTTGATFPIELIGQGVSLYGQKIATTQYFLLENFANSVSPSNPVTGMTWYDSANGQLNYYNGTEFIALDSMASNGASLFPRLASANGIDLTTVGTTPIFTDPNVGGTYHATGLLLKVNGTPALVTPAMVNLQVSTSEDVMENVSVNLADASHHGYYIIQGTTMVATGGASISLEVVTAATTSLGVDAYLFGFRT